VAVVHKNDHTFRVLSHFDSIPTSFSRLMLFVILTNPSLLSFTKTMQIECIGWKDFASIFLTFNFFAFSITCNLQKLMMDCWHSKSKLKMIDTYLAMLTIQHRTIVFVEDLKYPYEDRISCTKIQGKKKCDLAFVIKFWRHINDTYYWYLRH